MGVDSDLALARFRRARLEESSESRPASMVVPCRLRVRYLKFRIARLDEEVVYLRAWPRALLHALCGSRAVACSLAMSAAPELRAHCYALRLSFVRGPSA